MTLTHGRLTHNSACVHDKKGGSIWFDDAKTLPDKYKVARKSELRGVGIWKIARSKTGAWYLLHGCQCILGNSFTLVKPSFTLVKPS